MTRQWRMPGLIAAVMLGLALVGVRPAAAQISPVGQAKGSGLITVQPGGEGHFNFHVERVAATAPIVGDLSFVNRVTGDNVRSLLITLAFFGPNFVGMAGTCEVDGQPGNFSAFALDNGEPGEFDFFSISYNSPGGSAAAGSQLLSGNVEVGGN